MAPAEQPAAGSTARRDLLLRLQAEAQARWEADKLFESDAPGEGQPRPPKFFGTFPYPYMNGLLHLGHAFSLSKLEFAAAWHRLKGDRVLFAQAFHCTGMPIKACADKLAGEIDAYGCPPVFPDEADDGEAAAAEAAAAAAAATERDPSKFVGKKSKAAAKKGAGASQWEIMELSGIAADEIPAFRDASHWLRYFPPLARRDIAAMGCGVDWRRSFITTDANPYYDAFVRWQMNTLKAAGKIVKDKRLAIFSPKDGQPCADHDRATGEGVGPQEYTLIKMKALELRGGLAALAGKGDVFLLAATLRPETMYGQTNAWALPSGEYGAYEAADGSIYVLCARAARNLAYQGKLACEPGDPTPLAVVSGADLIGTPLASPSAPNTIYVLPLLTILMGKGTGIVTSVPSDAPDDWAALRDLKTKPALRAKHGVADDWVLPYEVVPIIDVPGYGDKSAEKACLDLGVASQNDAKKLADAKAAVYLKGFTDGVLLVGPHAGEKVCDAKPKIRAAMVERGDAVSYSEPERAVVSRSGDDCVVALTDQWYIVYGEDEWADATRRCLDAMDTYTDDARHAFAHTLSWLRQWACSRSFGLGTRLPWDPDFLVESLSDSTIYMAYYAIAHILQGGDMYGQKSDVPIPAPALSDAIFDAIFLDAPLPADTPADIAAVVARCHAEFDYWYPMDLRVSGKDLINNHLTFCLYTHTAVWAARPDRWPRSMRTNGHLLLNAEKMSKSTGNFKTLAQAIAEYGADAMRIALADAGDAMDDANFEHAVANGAILRLTRELEWATAVLPGGSAAATRSGDLSFFDRVFDNAINAAIAAAAKAYDRLKFRDAVKAALYDLHAARDAYRVACGDAPGVVGGDGLHADLVARYVDASTRLLAPIAPHYADHVWRAVLGRDGTVLTAGVPAGAAPDPVLAAAAAALDKRLDALRKSIAKVEAPPKKKGAAAASPPPRVVGVDLYVAPAFGGWRAAALAALDAAYDEATGTFADGALAAATAAAAEPFVAEGGAAGEKALKQAVAPFARKRMDDARGGGAAGRALLQPALPFDEAALLADNAAYLERCLGVKAVRVHTGAPPAGQSESAPPLPGEPSARFETEARA